MLSLHRRKLLAGVALLAGARPALAGTLPLLSTGPGSRTSTSPPTNVLSTAGGSGTVPTINTSVHGSGWPYTVIGAWDTPNYTFFDPTDGATICVGASTGDSSGVDHVTFYLNGNSLTVTQPSLNSNNNTYGFCVSINSTGGLDGDYTLYARVVPVNGYEILLSLLVTLNTNGTIARPIRYVNYTTGSNANDGLTSGTPWKTICYATGAGTSGLSDGVADIIVASGTYLEDTNGSVNNNTRTTRVRAAAAASVTISRTTKGSPTRDVNLGCRYVQLVGMTVNYQQCNVVNGSVYTTYLQMNVVDPQGVLGPTYAYNANQNFDAFYVAALLESTVLCAMFPANLERNNTCYASWDAWVVNGSAQTRGVLYGQVARWGVRMIQPAQYQQRAHNGDTPTVSSVVFDGTNTVLHFPASTIVSNLTQLAISLVSGTFTAKTVLGAADNGSGATRLTLNNTTGLTTGDGVMIRGYVGSGDLCAGGSPMNDFWRSITVIDGTHIDLPTTSAGGTSNQFAAFSGNPAGMAWVSGGTVMKTWDGVSSSVSAQTATLGGNKTASVTAGDTVWISTPAHSDTDQYFSSANAIPYYNNIYWQRVWTIGMSLQGVLCQPGSFTATGTVSGGDAGAGGVVTFTSAQTIGANGWIRLTSGAQSGNCFRIPVAISASTTATLSTPAATAIPAGSAFQIVPGITNHAQVECFFNMYSSAPTSSQIQGGALHWVMDGCTWLQTYNFRSDLGAKAGEAFTIRNSIFSQMTNSGGFPSTGYTADNCQLLGGSVPGFATNTTVVAATFNGTVGNNYGRPTSGVTRTMTPPIPYDCSGQPSTGVAITAGTNIGALSI